jgi:hypothetical protein
MIQLSPDHRRSQKRSIEGWVLLKGVQMRDIALILCAQVVFRAC